MLCQYKSLFCEKHVSTHTIMFALFRKVQINTHEAYVRAFVLFEASPRMQSFTLSAQGMLQTKQSPGNELHEYLFRLF